MPGGGRVAQSIHVTPDEDLRGRRATLERPAELHFGRPHHAGEQHPHRAGLAELYFVQRQTGFLRIAADAACHHFNLGRFLFKRGIQLATEHMQIVATDLVVIGLIACELREHRVAVFQRADQVAAFLDGGVDTPFFALVEARDLVPTPTPGLHHVVEHIGAPVFGGLRPAGGETQIGLDIETTSQHVEPHRVVARHEVLFDLGIHENVRIEAVEIDVFGLDALFVALAQ